MATECPDCGANVRGKQCRCGWSVIPQTTGPAPVDWRCTWSDFGRRCSMAAESGTGDKGRCSWHSNVATVPRLLENYDEFDRWCGLLLVAPYCSQWTHHPARVLWECVHGRMDAPPPPTPCTLGSCRHRPEPPGEDVPVKERMRLIREAMIHAQQDGVKALERIAAKDRLERAHA